MTASCRAGRALLFALTLVACLFGGAAPAVAHAVLERTTPGADAVLTGEAPAAVELRFSEPVDAGLGGVRVTAPDGDRVDRGRVDRLDGGRSLRAPVDGGGEGTYTVAWSVVSEDGHTINGSFLYSVGRVTGAAEAGDDGRSGARLLGGVGRWAAFAGLLLLVGCAAFRRLVGGAGPRLRRLSQAAAVATALGVAGALLAQVSLAAGRTLPASAGLLPDAVTGARFGTLAAARIGLAVVAACLLLSRRSVAVVAADLATLALVVATSVSGHAWTTTPRWGAVALDVAHLLAAGAWVGGLGALYVTADRADGDESAVPSARRFSRVALAAVVVVVATGTVSSYLQVRSADALRDTGYGVLLLAKVALVAVLVGLGWLNRRRLLARAPSRATLLALLRAEVACAVVVVGVTAALVNRPPARDTVMQPYTASAPLAGDLGGEVELQVTPARSGPNDVHLYFLSPEGLPRPVDAAELTIERSDVPARRVALTPVTADHTSAYAVVVPSPGRWTFRVTAVHRGATATAVFEVPVR